MQFVTAVVALLWFVVEPVANSSPPTPVLFDRVPVTTARSTDHDVVGNSVFGFRTIRRRRQPLGGIHPQSTAPGADQLQARRARFARTVLDEVATSENRAAAGDFFGRARSRVYSPTASPADPSAHGPQWPPTTVQGGWPSSVANEATVRLADAARPIATYPRTGTTAGTTGSGPDDRRTSYNSARGAAEEARSPSTAKKWTLPPRRRRTYTTTTTTTTTVDSAPTAATTTTAARRLARALSARLHATVRPQGTRAAAARRRYPGLWAILSPRKTRPPTRARVPPLAVPNANFYATALLASAMAVWTTGALVLFRGCWLRCLCAICSCVLCDPRPAHRGCSE